MKSMLKASVCLVAVAILAGGCGQWAGKRAMEKGLASLRQGDHAAAVKQLEKASRYIKDVPLLYYNLGTAHYQLGHYDDALRAFQTALDPAPADRETMEYLGAIQLKRQDWAEALRMFQKAGAGLPPDARLLTAQAQAADGAGRRDAARLYLLRALRADRAYAPAVYDLACLYRDKCLLPVEALDGFEIFVRTADQQDARVEKAKASIARLKQVLEHMPPSVAPGVRRDLAAAQKLVAEGDKQRLSRQWAKAEKAYRDALAADPGSHDATAGLGLVLKARGDAAGALKMLLRAANLEPLRPTTMIEGAQLAMGFKDYSTAARLLDRAIARWPTQAPCYAWMAQVRHAEGHPAEARLYAAYYVLLAPAGAERDRYEAWLRTLPES